MGIPKYFRYISERWPTISQLVNDSVIPEFDNFYLDMNSILHTCTHKDNDPTHVLSEAEMYVAIFNYIEHLVATIKPKSVLYMAIDGVAPRAKMNQQRSRRFRSALDQETARRKAIESGVELPKEDPFDTNAITPGTEFMAKLTVQLKYFIHRKVTEDADWQDIRVVLSGHEVPGEGEHKIMNFIRSLASDENYNSNTRHCLYGLDADLIMLGLSTHQPHFSLLREEVFFGRSERFQSAELSEKRFFLLHLSLVREYLQLEFRNVLESGDDETQPSQFDFERILDDFILINFFIGNDFLPELPLLLIKDGAIPEIMDTYMRYLSKVKDYITENGKLNFANLKLWLKEMAQYQYQRFEEEAVDAEWLNNQLELVSNVNTDEPETLILTPSQRDIVRVMKPFILNSVLADDPTSEEFEVSEVLDESSNIFDRKFVELLAQQTGFIVQDGIITLESIPGDKRQWVSDTRKILRVYEKAQISSAEDDLNRQALYDSKFNQWSDRYYRSKFGVRHDDPKVKEVVRNYLEGLQWVLGYYYQGCPSWSWYFHGHYAPMIVELFNGITLDFKVEFGPSRPFLPFEQLMGVLPDRSSKLVPAAYRDLMSSPQSPIIDFYPNEFQLDLNGKKADWEAVVLIPFIDEKRLIDALTPRENRLTEAERARNIYGSDLEFTYTPQSSYFYPSSMPGVVPDLPACAVAVLSINPHDKSYAETYYARDRSDDPKFAYMAGFPTLKTLDWQFEIEKAHVRVFEYDARNESIILHIKNDYSSQTIKELVALIGESAYVDWPFLREAKITGVSNRDVYFSSRKGSGTPHDARVSQLWSKQLPTIKRNYESRGVDLGSVDVLVHYQPLVGLLRKTDGSYVKEFNNDIKTEKVLPVQLLVEDIEEEDERFKEREPIPVADEYPVDSRAVLLMNRHYGAPVTVTGHTDTAINVEALALTDPEPQFGNQVASREKSTYQYFSAREVADSLGISFAFLSRLTSRFMFVLKNEKINLGLVLKRPAQNLKASGYTRMGFKGWEYSQKGLLLILAYLKSFPVILQALASAPQSNTGIPDLRKVLPESISSEEIAHQVRSMKTWLNENASKIQFVPMNDETLSDEGIAQIEKWAVEYSKKPIQAHKIQISKLPRAALLTPASAHHQLRRQKFFLGNRVVSAVDFGKVPLYARGTVVGINEGASHRTLNVVFDAEFGAGSTLDQRVKTKRGLVVQAGTVINLTFKQLAYDRNQDNDVLVPAVPQARSTKRVDTRQRNLKPAPVSQSVWTKAKPAPAGPASKAPAGSAPKAPAGPPVRPAAADMFLPPVSASASAESAELMAALKGTTKTKAESPGSGVPSAPKGPKKDASHKAQGEAKQKKQTSPKVPKAHKAPKAPKAAKESEPEPTEPKAPKARQAPKEPEATKSTPPTPAPTPAAPDVLGSYVQHATENAGRKRQGVSDLLASLKMQ
ncbi:5'-3' exoribonuclease 1 [Wickerhamiella sorbophila]|uniref:5'-3' exoribonuclease 1 n=1 Tax=Wickerhamiella sorbophila TaxID=45607 RepID=A0A2T0FHM8_9ASCO|nr:5'-3' exoribonuclease 1 [Wickerhamiella sorbophila]PRT54494.1 5'-3' exoribonuclease 1 [Wickerhamiella sorbophila]